MSNRFISVGIAAALAVICAPAVLAQDAGRGKLPEKHDSNTLHKLGKAIQYPVRKAGENTSKSAHVAGKAVQYPVRKTAENTSVTAHRVVGKNSVVRRKNGKKRHNTIVKPNGDLKRIQH